MLAWFGRLLNAMRTARAASGLPSRAGVSHLPISQQGTVIGW